MQAKTRDTPANVSPIPETLCGTWIAGDSASSKGDTILAMVSPTKSGRALQGNGKGIPPPCFRSYRKIGGGGRCGVYTPPPIFLYMFEGVSPFPLFGQIGWKR